MPYLMPDAQLAFFFSPKAGGTSLRAYLFHLENGFAFRDYTVQGKVVDANELVKNTRWKAFDPNTIAGFETIAVIRDPVRRFLSGYSNRVLHYRELSIEKAGSALEEMNLPPDPDIDDFVENFHSYKTASWNFRRHFWPQQSFLGPDKDFYTAVYRLENIAALVRDFNTRFGVDAEMPRLQDGGRKLNYEELSKDAQQGILNIVRSDVAFEMYPAYGDSYAL